MEKYPIPREIPQAADGRDHQGNWRVVSLIFHVVLPIMFLADWFLFYERSQCKWYYPIAAIVLSV